MIFTESGEMNLDVRNSEQFEIDDIDADLRQFKWYVKKNGYAYRVESRAVGGKKIYLQREILSRKLGRLLTRQDRADHEDRNKMNNRRGNIRPCTQALNACNSKDRERKNSRYRGVYLHRQTGLWQARIRVHPAILGLGYFHDEESAARAYDDAAIQHHGEFATTNAKLGLFRA